MYNLFITRDEYEMIDMNYLEVLFDDPCTHDHYECLIHLSDDILRVRPLPTFFSSITF